MTRVFKNRAEAEKAGWVVAAGGGPYAFKRNDRTGARAAVRTDLECQLAEALEAVEFITARTFYQQGTFCPCCFEAPGAAHRDDCKLSLGLKAFRGETT